MKLMLMMLAGLLTISCTSKKAEQAEEPAKKVLVLYYSSTNTTKQMAEYIQQKTDADMEAIELVNEYPTDFQEAMGRVGQDREGNVLPELKPLKANLDNYDVIFLGYPIWFGTYALPIKTLLASGVLNGKTVVPFCTSGSSGVKQSADELKQATQGVQMPASMGVRASLMDKMPATVDRVLISLGLMEGENETLADYSAQQPVTEAEAEIFNKAISTYPMMSGATAVSVGSRATSKGTDYLFKATSAGPGGNNSQMDVFVTKENGDADPYFTGIDR